MDIRKMLEEEEAKFSKYFCVHGICITDYLQININYLGEMVRIHLIPYIMFAKSGIAEDIINKEEIVECDVIAMIRSCNNNTLEVEIVKTALSILYFSNRMKHSKRRIKRMKPYDELHRYHDYLANYKLGGGYFGENHIESTFWFIKLGKRKMDNDDFERWITSGYGEFLLERFDRRDGIENYMNPRVEVDSELNKEIRYFTDKLDKNDEYSKKVLSALRLYFEIMCDFKNPDYTIILCGTIFETLLLNREESNQRKKVAARSACITFNNLDFKYKRYVANQVYHFYRYRNNIVHDGMGIMNFSEFLFNDTLYGIKNIIFSILKYIVENDVKTNTDIINIVNRNVQLDGLSNGFDYIEMSRFENNPNYIMPACID